TLQRAKITEPYGYLLKPYEEQELHTTIELALFKHKMQRISQEMRRWLGAVIRSIGDGIIVTDSKGCVRIINKSAQSLSGRSEDEVFGQPLQDAFPLVHASKRAPVDGLLSRAGRNNGPVDLEADTVLMTPEGKGIRVEGNLAPITDEAGNLAGYVMVF